MLNANSDFIRFYICVLEKQTSCVELVKFSLVNHAQSKKYKSI
jgi:hypothetical protein